MGRKARDPERTGREPTPPWNPKEPCPCGSGALFVDCCLGRDGYIYKSPARRRPPPPATGVSHDGCYMGWSKDCSKHISREHFISAAVLKHLGGDKVTVKGLPWLPTETIKILAINSLTGNILCERHNSAFASLDTVAGDFFKTLAAFHHNILDNKTLSRRWQWSLFSGEEIELWMLKTALGLFHSGNASKNKIKLSHKQTINPACCSVLDGGSLRPPCGLYVNSIHFEQLNQVQWTPLSDDAAERMIGLRVTYLSFELLLLFDPNSAYGPSVTKSRTYRPTYLMVTNAKRNHTAMLTWPLTASRERRIVRVTF
jgi:hypothetical protein